MIEVSDNSLARDLGVKLRLYAGAGIGQYVVVDLVHDVVLDHRMPRGVVYERLTTLRPGEALQISGTTGALPVPVEHLLP